MPKLSGTEIIRENPPLWDDFTRKEEYGCESLDRYERFMCTSSICPDVSSPEVSRYLIQKGLRVDLPEDKEFALVLTHDVDQICPSLAKTALLAASCVRQMDLRECGRQLFWRFKGVESSPFRTFKHIMDIEERYGARSTFFFMTKGPDFTRGGYPVDDFSQDVANVSDRGWEVGLHGTYDAYLSAKEMMNQKEKLEGIVGKKISGYRNHYLRFKVPDTWRAVHDAGFAYDSTLGYAEHVGFRNGMVHPFQPFDLETEATIPLLELPLAVMEGTLYETSKMGLSLEEGWKVMERLLRTAKECRGTLVVLWHNMTFGNPSLKDWAKMYERLLKKGKDEGGWLCSGGELADWWAKNGFRSGSGSK